MSPQNAEQWSVVRVRINDLARELHVPSKQILDSLGKIGIHEMVSRA